MAAAAPALPVPGARPLARRVRRPKETVFHGLILAAVLILVGALIWLFGTIIRDGAGGLSLDFITDKDSRLASRAGFDTAIRGSVVLMFWTAITAFPIGFAAAIYLEKFAKQNRLNRLIEVNIANLAAVPSIIYGLLALALFIAFLGLGKSLLAGGLTLGLLVLPIVIITSRESLRAVPKSIEEAAMALGATRWQAVSRQTVPAAIPGMLTGTILAFSRAIGETAPLVVVGGLSFTTGTPAINPLDANSQPLVAMPLQIYSWAGDFKADFVSLSAAGIIVLLGVLVVLNSIAIVLRNRYSRSW